MKRFQSDKEEDLRKYMVSSHYLYDHEQLTENSQLAFARCHVEWAQRSLETWEEARAEVNKIPILEPR